MTCKIKSLCKINEVSLKNEHNLSHIEYLDTANLNQGNIDALQRLHFGVDEIPSRAKRVVRENDILFSTVRPNQLHYGFVSKPKKNLICSTGFTVLSPKANVVPYYLYKYLTQKPIIEYLQGIAETSTSTYPSIKPSDIGELEVDFPSLIVQQSIANILSSLDDKIELNNKINKNLEEIAQTLYKRWFVDFEFPNENGEPYKSSGGDMVDSELGMIPKGWEVKELQSVINNKKERVGLKTMPVLSAVKEGQLVLSSDFFTKNVPSSNLSKYLIVGPREFSYNPARINIGSIGMNEFDFHGCVSPIYVVLRPDGKYANFFRLYFKTSTFNDEVVLRASGSVRQSLNFDDFGRIKIVYPSEGAAIKFNKIYDSIYSGIKSNMRQTQYISKIRDELLPKLMSGELEVPVEE